MSNNIITSFITDNPISSILAILGFIGTVYGLCVKRGYKLGYFIKTSFPLSIDKELSTNLQIFYNNQQIKTLKETTILLFNKGDKPLRKEDLYSNHWLLSVDEGQILQTSITSNKQEGKFALKRLNNKKYEITFDYFNPKQIFEINLLHEISEIILSCQAAGLDNLKKYNNELDILNFITSTFMLFMSSVGIYSMFIRYLSDVSLIRMLIPIVLSLLVIGAIVLQIWRISISIPYFVKKYKNNKAIGA